MDAIKWGILVLIGMFLSCSPPEPETQPYNVLFIAVDDLRPQLNCYGETYMHTPNLDKLAASGRLFQRHYVQVPTCGASRHALLTGIRPSTEAHTKNSALRDLLPTVESEQPETFAHLFRRNGYYTASIGKIGHYVDQKIYTYEGEGDGRLEMPFSWDEVWGPVGKWGTAWNAFFGYADGSNRNMKRGHYPAFEAAAVPDTAYPDGLIAEKAIETMQRVKDKPFMMAVGFFKPHLPFTAPQKYWDLYDSTTIEISENPDLPIDINPNSIHKSGEMFGNYAHREKGDLGVRISDAYARKLRHGYYASVSFADAQVGKVLDELDRLGLREKTIVVVWGDHGWHLGDHTIWGKHSTFERSLRSALIIQVPGMEKPGTPTNGLVETLDLYPTLTDLCGLEYPKNLTGSSLVPLLNDPTHAGKDGAIGYWRKRKTLRTDRYRLVAFDNPIPYELFDLDMDPLETKNIANQHPEIVEELAEQLEKGHPHL